MTTVLYDTTLRDGTQGEGINLSVSDKLRIAQRLDDFGMHYIEGGWPGSNPKDAEFFARARELRLKQARVAAFGSTRRAGGHCESDPQIKMLLDAQTPVVTMVAKTSRLHVTHVLETTLEENLAMIRDSVAYFKAQGKEVMHDAEHFFDGFKLDKEYALATLRAAAEAGADWLILCETNGGQMPWRSNRSCARPSPQCNPARMPGLASTPTTMRASAWQTRWLARAQDARKCRARSTDMASASAIAT